MRSVSKRQKAHDPEAVCSVTSFTARPLLRVGGKDKGTRFLSFVDAMLGFRHLLTADDLNKASSLCTSMKGTLKSKFIVLSDDKMLPPPPSARRKRVLSGDQEQSLPSKNSRPEKSSARVSKANPGTSAQAQAQAQAQVQAQVHTDVSLGDRPFQIVDRSRKKSLPAGVTLISKRTTPRRAAKDKAVSSEIINQDEHMSEASGSGSASEDEGAGSDGTVVEVMESDWVILSSVCSISLIISLLTPFSTIISLFITDLSRLN